jgi:hypothetical protein
MSRRSRSGRKAPPTFTGCTPHAFSVLSGALAGALVLIASGQGFTPAGIAYLLAGYVAGAVGGYLLAVALRQIFGQWWDE